LVQSLNKLEKALLEKLLRKLNVPLGQLNLMFGKTHKQIKSVVSVPSASKPMDNHKSETKGSNMQARGLPDTLFKEGSRLLDAYLVVCKSISDHWTDVQWKTYITTIVNFYNSKIKHHGITGGTSKYKDVITYVIALSEGRNPDNPGWVATEPDSKVPTALKDLSPLIAASQKGDEKSYKDYQALITLLAIPRLSKELPELDLSSIEKPFPESKVKGFNNFMKDFKA